MNRFTIFLLMCVLLLLVTDIDRAQELRRSGVLGIVAAALTDAARKQLQPDETGIQVQSVVDGGSAIASGKQANDIITRVNDRNIVDVADFLQTAKGLR